MQNIFEQVTELPERDTIVTELVETTVVRRWPCHVCGGHTEKVDIVGMGTRRTFPPALPNSHRPAFVSQCQSDLHHPPRRPTGGASVPKT